MHLEVHRSLQMLQEWCSFELHTVVVDAAESQLEDDIEENECDGIFDPHTSALLSEAIR